MDLQHCYMVPPPRWQVGLQDQLVGSVQGGVLALCSLQHPRAHGAQGEDHPDGGKYLLSDRVLRPHGRF